MVNSAGPTVTCAYVGSSRHPPCELKFTNGLLNVSISCVVVVNRWAVKVWLAGGNCSSLFGDWEVTELLVSMVFWSGEEPSSFGLGVPEALLTLAA